MLPHRLAPPASHPRCGEICGGAKPAATSAAPLSRRRIEADGSVP